MGPVFVFVFVAVPAGRQQGGNQPLTLNTWPVCTPSTDFW
jgi:hypothetical protein